MKTRFLRVISGAILLTFTATTCLVAAPVAPTAEGKPSASRRIEDLASLIDVHEGRPDRPTVFYIQDAHSILSAQQAIQGLIDILQKSRSVSLIALEGGSGPLDMDLLRSYPDPEKLKKVLWSYASKGEVSGVEVQAALGPRALFQGIESQELYEQSLIQFQKAQLEFATDSASLGSTGTALARLAEKFFPPELLQLAELRRSFEEQELSLPAFLEHLKGFGLKVDNGYPALSQMVGVLQKEETAEKDAAIHSKLLEWVKSRFKDSAETNRIRQDFETSRATLGDTVRALLELEPTPSAGAEREPLQNIASKEDLENISGSAFMEELNQWLSRKEEMLAQGDPKAGEILQQIRNFELLKHLLSLEITSGEWKEIQKDPAAFQTSNFKDFFKRFSVDAECGWDTAPASHFYELASERDIVLFKNFEKLAALGTSADDAIVLITGGFHTEGITRQLRGSGFSYQVLSPRFHMEGENPYLKVMSGDTSYAKNASVASVPPPVTFDGTSPYHARMMANIVRELLPEEGSPEFFRVILDWLNQLVQHWRNGAADPDISRPVKTLRLIADSAVPLAAVTGRSLGGEKEKGTGIFKAPETPDVLNTHNTRRDSFNLLATLLEDPRYGFSRGIVFLANEKFVEGYVGMEASYLTESAIHRTANPVVSRQEDLAAQFTAWKKRGLNLNAFERMAKGYNFGLSTEGGLIASLVKDARNAIAAGRPIPHDYLHIKRSAENKDLDEDSLLLPFDRMDLPKADEFYLVPMIHNNEVIGVLYVDDLGKEGPPGFSEERINRLKIFCQSAAKSYISSREFEIEHYKATHDHLTDLYNPTGLQERFQDDLMSTIENRRKLSLVAIDFDHLRKANAAIGHPNTNLFFVQIAKTMKREAPPEAVNARVGGDEFIIVLPNTNTDKAWSTTETIRNKVHAIRVEKTEIPEDFRISISAGIATYGAVKTGEGYVALIPYTHDERAAKITTQLTAEVEEAIKNSVKPKIGGRVISVEGETHTVFLFDENKDAVKPLKDQVDALQHSAYEALSQNADTALYVSKQNRNKSTIFSLEVQRQREQIAPEELIRAFRQRSSAEHKLDRKGAIIDVTDGWLLLLGYTREEVLGKKVFDFMPEKDRLKAENTHQQRMMGVPEVKNPFKIRRYLNKRGKEVILTSTHDLDINDKKEIVSVTTTLQKGSMIDFLTNRAQSSGIDEVAFDKDGNIGYVSQGFAIKLGYEKPENLKGLSIFDLFPEKEKGKIKDLIQSPAGTKAKVTVLDASGNLPEVSLFKLEFDEITSFVFDLKTHSAGKSLGSPANGVLTPEYFNSLAELISAKTSLQPVAGSEADLWAKQIFHLTGLTDQELDGESARYLEDRKVSPHFFKATGDVKISSFLLLDLDSLAGEPGLLVRAAELVGEDGKILPFATDRTSPKSLENFLTQLAKLSKDQPALGPKVLPLEKVARGPLTAKVVGRIKDRSGLKDASLGILVSRPQSLEGDYAVLVPADKQSLAFVFDAASNHSTLTKTVYSVAFNAFLRGADGLDILRESFVKQGQGAGITLYSFDLVELAAALTAEWQAEAAFLRAA